MLRKLFVSTLVAAGLWVSLIGPGMAQETTMEEEIAFLRFGPGVAGNVTAEPLFCRPGVPCETTLAGASVQVLGLDDDRKVDLVGLAVTNTLGQFVVSVPPGEYLVHVDTELLSQCADMKITVGKQWLTFVTIDCASILP